MKNHVFAAAMLLLFLPSIAKSDPVFMTGGDGGDTSDIANSPGTISVQTTVFRSGGYAYKMNPTTTGIGYIEIRGRTSSGSSSASEPNTALAWGRVYYRAHIVPAANNEEILVFRNTGNTADKLAVRIGSDRKLAVYNAAGTLVQTGTVALTLDLFYRVTAKASNGISGAWQLDLYDDPPSGNGTGAPTLLESMNGTTNQGATNLGMLRVGKVTNRFNNSVEFYYDDIYYDDAADPGPGRNYRVMPSGDGAVATWVNGTVIGGSLGQPWQQVNETPGNGDTTYAANTGAAGDIHRFSMQDGIVPAGSTINAVAVCALAREEISGTSSFLVGMRSGATTLNASSGRDLTTSYANLIKISGIDPDDSLAWDVSDIDALEAVITESNAIVDHSTSVYTMVDAEAPTAPTPTPTATPTATATFTPSNTPTATATATATFTPSNTPTATATPTNTPVATATNTPVNTPTPNPTAAPGSGKLMLRERREG